MKTHTNMCWLKIGQAHPEHHKYGSWFHVNKLGIYDLLTGSCRKFYTRWGDVLAETHLVQNSEIF